MTTVVRFKMWCKQHRLVRAVLELRGRASDFYRYRLISERRFIRRRFAQVFGYLPDLDNPRTFNEKLQWLKLNDRTPLHTQCADKYRMRQHVAAKVGAEHLVPLLYDTDNVSDIRPEKLPEAPFVLKTNHASGRPILVRDKSVVDWISVRKRLTREMKSNYYYLGKEWQYKNITPHIVVEKMLLTADGNIPFDYKFHCFNGRIVFVQVDIRRYTDRRRRNLYDDAWNRMDFEWLQPSGEDLERPHAFGRMKQIAEVLAADFTYVRVDLYLVDENIFVGELTFHPTSGFGPFSPPEWDRKLGDMLALPVRSP